MKKLLVILFILPLVMYGQTTVTLPASKKEVVKKQPSDFMKRLKKEFKYSTFYAAYNGNNSVSDVTNYSVTDGLTTTKTETQNKNNPCETCDLSNLSSCRIYIAEGAVATERERTRSTLTAKHSCHRTRNPFGNVGIKTALASKDI